LPVSVIAEWKKEGHNERQKSYRSGRSNRCAGQWFGRAILNDPNGGFTARVLTRDVNGARAKNFARLGAEVVTVDIDNLESLEKAFEGAYAAFCITFFWAHFSPEKEMAEAKSMVAAAKATALRHVIWSTLEDTRQWVPLTDNRMPTLQAKYKVLHSDSKGQSNHFFTDAAVPTTFLLTSLYWDNFIYFGMGPKKGPDGTLVITFPMGDKKLPGIAAEDIGKCAYGIFKECDEFIGKTVAISGENLTGAQIAALFTEVLGREVRYNSVSPAAYRGFGFAGADTLGNHFQFLRDFEDYFCGVRDPNFARTLNPSLQSFKMWLTQNKSAIPLEAAA
jgi:uncharacterized protein YbjT (DUF2867 family)